MSSRQSKRRNFRFCLCLIFFLSLWGIENAHGQDCLKKLAEGDLTGKIRGMEPLNYDAGDGVKLLLTPVSRGKRLIDQRPLKEGT